MYMFAFVGVGIKKYKMLCTYIKIHYRYFSKRIISERKWCVNQIFGNIMKNDGPKIIINLLLSKIIL
jgi:hypothetical protein